MITVALYVAGALGLWLLVAVVIALITCRSIRLADQGGPR